MFVKDSTSEIIAFVNSIIRAEKTDTYKVLLDEAMNELGNRIPMMKRLYI